MSTLEIPRYLPDLLDKVHLETARRKLGRRGIEIASWADIEAIGGLDLDADTVIYWGHQEPIGELFGREQRLRMSVTNSGFINDRLDERKFNRRVIMWDGEDIANNDGLVHILVGEHEVAALRNDEFHYYADMVRMSHGGTNELIIGAARERNAIQVVPEKMVEKINSLIVQAPDYQ